jgi:hypothetical protein
MPKRVIDFDAMWGSDKLASCADWAQAEYAWLYGLADASGCFEITNLRVIWGRVAAIRRNLTIERLEQIFLEFQDKGLLFVWEYEGKRYAHWTGSDVPGRLPPPSWRMRLERFAPPVPKQKLTAYMARFARGRAALAGAGFRGEERYGGQELAEDRRFEISDLKGDRQAGAPPEDSRWQGTRDEEVRASRTAAAGGGGLKGEVEEAQGQDLDLNLDLNRSREREGDLRGGGCGETRDVDPDLIVVSSFESTPNSNTHLQGTLNFGANVPADPTRAAGSETPPEMNSEADSRRALSRPAASLSRGVENGFEARLMSAKELAVARELRVGQGPVCGPKGVKQEVIERDRLRELARAKAL